MGVASRVPSRARPDRQTRARKRSSRARIRWPWESGVDRPLSPEEALIEMPAYRGSKTIYTSLLPAGTLEADYDDGGEEVAFMDIAPGFLVLRVEANYACRVRAYDDVTSRSADVGRARNVPPDIETDHGVLMDLVLTNAMNKYTMSPAPEVHSSDGHAVLPLLIQNRDTVARTIAVTVHYVQTER